MIRVGIPAREGRVQVQLYYKIECMHFKPVFRIFVVVKCLTVSSKCVFNKMPFVLSESLSGMSWSSNESIHAGSTANGSGFQTPSSCSSTPASPDSTLRRKRLKHTGSLNSIIQEPFVIRSDLRDSRSHSPTLQTCPKEEPDFISSVLSSIFGWYPLFLVKIFRAMLVMLLPQTWWQLLLMLPVLWVSMWIWVFNQVLHLPFTVLKIFLSLMFSQKSLQNATVLISGGSSIQALHLARNFHSAGAKVIMCEVEGLFALARFSTAVSTFYTVPKPTCDQLQNYVRALCKIVDKEQVNYYIPVCTSTSAYYDAVAKPHLELLGCCCFCPGIKEVCIFDDTLEVFKKCQKNEIVVPKFYEITSKEQLTKLYDNYEFTKNMYVMSTTGPRGVRERLKIILPTSKTELKVSENTINDHKPWIVVQNVTGDHYLTCTAVRNSQVIANVTCKMDTHSNSLISIEHKEIDKWITGFFNKLQLLRPVSGHFSFRFVICKNSNTIIPLSSQVGVSLPYICFSNMHPKLIWKHCIHSRQNSRIILENGHIKLQHSAIVNNVKLLSKNSFKSGAVLDRKKTLFKLSDPLPYCSYYYIHLPFKNFLQFLQRKQNMYSSSPQTNIIR